jgi:fructoselysine-6-phosphate deglycase
MLNFDEARFLRIQGSAVALAERVDAIVTEALGRGVENLYFLGTGGVRYLMMPAHQLLQRRSTFPAFNEYPAELVLTGARSLTDKSLVVMPSLSGTTRESVAMLERLKEIGAHTVTLVGNGDTPLGQGGDDALVNFAEDDTSSESFYIQSLLFALSIMRARGETADYEATLAGLRALPQALLELKRSFEPQAKECARAIAAADWHIFTGGGNVWPQALYYATCILEEMQWIRTRPVHASDFFHGTLELVENGVSVFVFKGEDEYRALGDRVEAFVLRYSERMTLFDTAALPLPGIDPAMRGLFAPIMLATVLERVSAHLEVMRQHPLVTRRYYKRVAY